MALKMPFAALCVSCAIAVVGAVRGESNDNQKLASATEGETAAAAGVVYSLLPAFALSSQEGMTHEERDFSIKTLRAHNLTEADIAAGKFDSFNRDILDAVALLDVYQTTGCQCYGEGWRWSKKDGYCKQGCR
eukprot:SRR837773.24042.p2 GENE.SRR837773.24042~~SRR837773.24042.p2  ORF type:complete len:133 (+),score=49.73 SRR837773.24042:35-433(+)